MPPRMIGPTRRARNSKLVTAREVASAAAQRPEQVGILAGRGLGDAPVGEDDLGRLERVDGQAVAAHEPAHSASERQPADARVRDLAGRDGEPVLLRRGVDLAQQRAAADADEGRLGVDLDAVERADVDAERAVAHRAAGDGVAARADREAQAGAPGRADRRGDVVRVGGVGDRGRPPVDGAVPAGSRAVEVGIGRLAEAADEPPRAQGDGEGGGECGSWSRHACHDGPPHQAGRRGFPLTATPIFARRKIGRAPPERGSSRSRPLSRILSWAAIHLGPALPPGSSRLPGARRAASSPLSGVAPGGVYRAGASPRRWCALTAPFHPCRRPRTVA